MEAARAELKYSEAAFQVSLAPSGLAAWTLAVAVLASLVLIAATPGPTAIRILAATWIACAALEALHRVALHRGPRGVRSIAFRANGAITVESAEGAWSSGTLCDGSFVAAWLTIIRWRPEGERFARAIAILPDMLPAEPFRRVRVQLRWSWATMSAS